MVSAKQRTRRPALWVLALLSILLVVATAACQSGATPAADQEPAAAQEAATVAPTAEAPTAEEPTAAASQAAEQPAAQQAESASPLTFQIVADGTQARFYIDEVLLGQDKTVVGTTSDVTGELRVDAQDPAASEVGPITINARDLTTDSDRRNGAIRRFILQSDRDEFQYITFSPATPAGLPDAVSVGEPFQFEVSGDLTVRDVTQPVTFAMTVTATSPTELSGLGVTTVNYPDFGLTIPSVPSVTGVQEQVRLELEFRAVAQ